MRTIGTRMVTVQTMEGARRREGVGRTRDQRRAYRGQLFEEWSVTVSMRSISLGINANMTLIWDRQPKNLDVPALLASSPHGSRTDFSEPTTPPTPPTHASSSMKRSSFARRHDINGTVVTEADLGSGYASFPSTGFDFLFTDLRLLLLSVRMSTVRPVRRVDADASQRASADYVGTIREKDESPVAGKHARKPSKEPLTTKGQAGKALVDEVVMPVIQRVRLILDTRVPIPMKSPC